LQQNHTFKLNDEVHMLYDWFACKASTACTVACACQHVLTSGIKFGAARSSTAASKSNVNQENF
jgi:hypothetical protein